MPPSIAIVTGSTMPHPDLDEAALLGALAARGCNARSVAWDDPHIDWSGFSVAIVRSTWNYESARGAFVSWAHRAAGQTVLLNPAGVIEWNTDKAYLAMLDRAGVAVVPTTFTAPDETWAAPSFPEYVVKPNIAGGARNAGRFAARGGDDAARALAGRIQASGRSVMTQPYLDRIDEDGERVLIFLGGEFSHAVLRGPILGRNGRLVDPTRGWKTVDSVQPSRAEIDLARRALHVLEAESLTYARVDLVTAGNGGPCVLEVELTEPCLFLAHKPGAVDALADLTVSAIRAGG